MNRKAVVFLSVFVLGVVVDQLTKYWVRANLALRTGEIEVIPNFFSIVHAENPGAAMGFLRNFEYRQYVFLAFTVIAIGVIVDLWRKLPSRDWFMSLTLGLILSGAIGNAIDRVHKQSVTDFLRVYAGFSEGLSRFLESTPLRSNEWPSFNVADAALVVGVGLFLIHYLFLEEKEEKAGSSDSAGGEPPPDEQAAPRDDSKRSEPAS